MNKESFLRDANFRVDNIKSAVTFMRDLKTHLSNCNGKIFNARTLATIPNVIAKKWQKGTSYYLGEYSLSVEGAFNNSYRAEKQYIRMRHHGCYIVDEIAHYADFEFNLPVVLDSNERIDGKETAKAIDQYIKQAPEQNIAYYEARIANYDAALEKYNEMRKLADEIRALRFHYQDFGQYL